MAHKMIEFTFEDDGTVKIEASGFQGGSCEQATRPFEEALGVVRGQRQLKPEHRLAAIAAEATAWGPK
jgi:hypothetical protein